MQDLSDAAIKNAYAQVVEPEAVLITITAISLLEPIKFCDQPDGVISNGDFYPFFPFTIVFGGASGEEPSRDARLEVANLDGSIALAIRTVTGKPRLTAQVVRLSDPNLVEYQYKDIKLSDAAVENEKITMTLTPRDFKREPACHARYIMARTPGLF